MLGSRFDLAHAIEKRAARRKAQSTPSDSAELPDQLVSRDDGERETPAATPRQGTYQQWRFRCPVCDETMRVCEECDLNEFSGLEVKLHRLECDGCGMLTGRVFHPSIGYDSQLVR